MQERTGRTRGETRRGQAHGNNMSPSRVLSFLAPIFLPSACYASYYTVGVDINYLIALVSVIVLSLLSEERIRES